VVPRVYVPMKLSKVLVVPGSTDESSPRASKRPDESYRKSSESKETPWFDPKSMSRSTVFPATPLNEYQSTSSVALFSEKIDAWGMVAELKILVSRARWKKLSTLVADPKVLPTSPTV